MDVTPELIAKATRFRQMHLRDQILILPNPWDRGTARLLQHLGFEAMATTSAGFANSLGLPDGAVGRDAALAHARDIACCTDLPVSADLENCYSVDPEGVAATVTAATETGIVGCSVEDATGIDTAPIYEFDLAVERVAAAVEAARQAMFPFTLTARAEGFLYGQTGLDEIIARLQAFEAAGADVVYAPGIRDIDTIRTIVRAVSVPVNVLARPGFTVARLEEMGVARVSVGSGLSRAAMSTFYVGAREVVEAGTFGYGLPARMDIDLNDIFADDASGE
jgi:2-methylisocitrate lyase-like PEP mutase family enzyme